MGIRRGEITTKIVSDGLVFNIDPANRASYPRTGTSVENTIFSSTGTMSATGMFDTSNQDTFAFDGAGDNIDFADNSLYDITDAISVFGWMYVTLDKGTGQNQYLLSKQNLYDIFITHDLKVAFYAKNISQPATYSLSAISINNWFYVGGTYDKDAGSNNTKVYINGVLSQEQTRTGAMGSDNNPVRIGSYSNSGGGGNSGWDMNGNIGITHIYNRALSAEEVLQNYNGLRGRFGL